MMLLEIRELKDLLDDGILTQEEFDAKKKQLLGILKENYMYTLNDGMTVKEASKRWGISSETIHNRMCTITNDETKFEAAVEAGLLKNHTTYGF